MRYCHSCKRLTAGEPLFCDHCGSTYDLRVCPRLHPNPRAAQVCAQCGSRELTTPQPARGWRARLAGAAVVRLPGVVLLAMTVALLAAMARELWVNQQAQLELLAAALLLAIAWWAYTQLPAPVRAAARKLGGRLRKGRRG